MARIRPTCKSVHEFSPHVHREHRSKKGRIKFVPEEAKGHRYFVAEKKSKKIESKIDRIIKNPVYGLVKEVRGDILPKKPIEKFPYLICENCGYLNKLRFSPIRMPELLSRVVCGRCQKPAYWKLYYTLKEILLNFLSLSWVRQAQHQYKKV